MICDECYHFSPSKWLDTYGCYIQCAACDHPDCFKKVRKQDVYGEIYYADKRTKNIIDFVNDDNECSNFRPFVMVKKPTFLWFSKKVKVPV